MRIAHLPLAEDRSLAVAGDRERGALIIELAIVALFVVTLLAGTFDFGMAWRGSLAVTEAARAGARVGSSVGDDVNADVDLLLGAQSALAASGMLNEVTRVVVYRSSTDGGEVPASCRSATVTPTAACNIFTGQQFRDITVDSDLDDDGCIEDSTTQRFCPEGREDVQAIADYVGVWIRVEHPYLFRLLGTVQTIERSAVMRIEPEESTG